ncbi:MAG: DUF4097 family beta strand repeat protein [Clostridia bacterium]|nr:DUF4097 family beta strand repeat protein [Clostridia bacterium]
MSRTSKIAIVIAVIIMVAGLVMFTASLFAVGFDFTSFSTQKYETNTHEIKDNFSSISVNTDTADIVFLPSDDGECKVVCYERENMKHSAFVKDDVLVIEIVDEREWYEYISLFNFDNEKINVFLPESEYKALTVEASTGDVRVHEDFKFESVDISVSTGDINYNASCTGSAELDASTGDIRVENADIGSLKLAVSTGKINVKNVNCTGDINVSVSTGDVKLVNVKSNRLFTKGDTGDISLKSFIAVDKLSIERSTGDVEIDGCDAGEIYIETSTGDVSGTVLTDKTFIADSSSGDIDVPRETRGGRCYIKTSSGDIEIRVKK